MKVYICYINFNGQTINYFDLTIDQKINWKQKSGSNIFFLRQRRICDDLPF